MVTRLFAFISMNKARLNTIILLIIAGGTLPSMSQTTLYFVQTRQVEGGNSKPGDNSNLFLTINDKGCYDSDRKGMTVGNGFLRYMGEGNGICTYHGESYWGIATYRLKADHSRLNIVDESKQCIYIYERRNMNNASCITSSKIKPKESKQSASTAVVPILPQMPEQKSENPKLKDVVCPSCNGTGRIAIPIPTAALVEGSQYCEYCQRYIKNTSWHIHQICSHCHGRKYIKQY